MSCVKSNLLIILVVVLAVSCKSVPETVQPDTGEGGSNQDDAFNPGGISQEYYVSTREEVQRFIESLNIVIQRGDYSAWRRALSPEYFAEISSAENLRRISDQPGMKTRRIVLRTPEDYFTHVVVPSRANLRVDDIEFISRNRVKAFTVTTNRAGDEQRLRLYDLEKIGNSWTIIN
ncbi:MAG: hypothetical protein LBI28_14715 [Treponema sp.]|jgi:hypothetical protein|nr:hypothetical protein [Treponema sp.]